MRWQRNGSGGRSGVTRGPCAEQPLHETSVVIPVHNRAALIEHTLASLLPERHPAVHLRVIVVDDGSTDGGAEAAKRVCPTVQVLRQPRRGAAAARNAGLACVTTETVLFLDSDDLVEPDFFLPRLDALADNPTAAGAYGPYDCFEGEGVFQEAMIRPRHTPYPVETGGVTSRSHLLRLLGGWYLVGPATLWRASVIRDLGAYDESLRVNQDVELMFRVLTRSGGLIGCTGPRALCREHALDARQGVVAGDRGKASDLLMLRRRFLSALTEAGLADQAARDALGRYCLDRWFELRMSVPDIAEEFYTLSRSISPRLRLEGRWPLRALASAFGARRALVIAQALRGGSRV